MFPKSLSFSKKKQTNNVLWPTRSKMNPTGKKKKNSACVVIYLKLYNFY